MKPLCVVVWFFCSFFMASLAGFFGIIIAFTIAVWTNPFDGPLVIEEKEGGGAFKDDDGTEP